MLEPATEEFKQSVCESLDTSLKQVNQDVEHLKLWIKSQPHLPQCSSDSLLTSFIIASKNRMERAKQRIDTYYTVRTEMPDIYADRDPRNESVQECAGEIRFFTLPKLTPDGYRVSIISLVSGEVSKYNLLGFSKRAFAAQDIMFNQEPFNKGVYFIVDGKYFTLTHALKLSPTLIRQLVYCGQDVLPMLIKGVIFINAPTVIDIVLGLLKPFMKSKLFQRIHVHTEGPEVLEKYFPKTLLPKDYGGDEETSDSLNEAWMKCLEKNRDWFLTDGSLTTDETKRIKVTPAKNKDMQELHGTFKTLCVD